MSAHQRAYHETRTLKFLLFVTNTIENVSIEAKDYTLHGPLACPDAYWTCHFQDREMWSKILQCFVKVTVTDWNTRNQFGIIMFYAISSALKCSGF